MPFITTTKRPVDAGHPEAPRDGWPASRRAVATLEEVADRVDEQFADHSMSYRRVVLALPEAGGTVGPLPDGTVIEVHRAPWQRIWEWSGWSVPTIGPPDAREQVEILAAWNAREARS